MLSGGLGSSPYLLKRVRSRLSNNVGPTPLNIEVLLSDEPQLSVCRGLVLDRLQKVTENRHVLTSRVCPKSCRGMRQEIRQEKPRPHPRAIL
ncbi:hypothetical protein BGAL_0007g00460 [Botrytis galanthina]|uniref:Uncharacterized protein n=1 Tax=Botrytis galanthina TaxID=278940 RepID=A0A4S8RFW4_9HELO|nr:hypothetical protein BGAL_0007g00460 [Botrytis galanthina]